jgi:hypothetical protein
MSDDPSVRLLEAANRVYEQVLIATIKALDAETGLTGAERAIALMTVSTRAQFVARMLAVQHGVPDSEITRWIVLAASLALTTLTTPEPEKLQ